MRSVLFHSFPDELLVLLHAHCEALGGNPVHVLNDQVHVIVTDLKTLMKPDSLIICAKKMNCLFLSVQYIYDAMNDQIGPVETYSILHTFQEWYLTSRELNSGAMKLYSETCNETVSPSSFVEPSALQAMSPPQTRMEKKSRGFNRQASSQRLLHASAIMSHAFDSSDPGTPDVDDEFYLNGRVVSTPSYRKGRRRGLHSNRNATGVDHSNSDSEDRIFHIETNDPTPTASGQQSPVKVVSPSRADGESSPPLLPQPHPRSANGIAVTTTTPPTPVGLGYAPYSKFSPVIDTPDQLGDDKSKNSRSNMYKKFTKETRTWIDAALRDSSQKNVGRTSANTQKSPLPVPFVLPRTVVDNEERVRAFIAQVAHFSQSMSVSNRGGSGSTSRLMVENFRRVPNVLFELDLLERDCGGEKRLGDLVRSLNHPEFAGIVETLTVYNNIVSMLRDTVNLIVPWWGVHYPVTLTASQPVTASGKPSKQFALDFDIMVDSALLQSQLDPGLYIDTYNSATEASQMFVSNSLKRLGVTRMVDVMLSRLKIVLRAAYPHIATAEMTGLPSSGLTKFQQLGLPSVKPLYNYMARVPMCLMLQCLQVRLEAVPVDRTELSAKLFANEFIELITQAVKVKEFYQFYVGSTDDGDDVTRRWNDECLAVFESKLLSCLTFYLDMVTYWLNEVQLQPDSNSLTFVDMLETRWNDVRSVAKSITGGDALVARKFCLMTSSLVDHIQQSIYSQLDTIKKYDSEVYQYMEDMNVTETDPLSQSVTDTEHSGQSSDDEGCLHENDRTLLAGSMNAQTLAQQAALTRSVDYYPLNMPPTEKRDRSDSMCSESSNTLRDLNLKIHSKIREMFEETRRRSLRVLRLSKSLARYLEVSADFGIQTSTSKFLDLLNAANYVLITDQNGQPFHPDLTLFGSPDMVKSGIEYALEDILLHCCSGDDADEIKTGDHVEKSSLNHIIVVSSTMPGVIDSVDATWKLNRWATQGLPKSVDLALILSEIHLPGDTAPSTPTSSMSPASTPSSTGPCSSPVRTLRTVARLITRGSGALQNCKNSFKRQMGSVLESPRQCNPLQSVQLHLHEIVTGTRLLLLATFTAVSDVADILSHPHHTHTEIELQRRQRQHNLQSGYNLAFEFSKEALRLICPDHLPDREIMTKRIALLTEWANFVCTIAQTGGQTVPKWTVPGLNLIHNTRSSHLLLVDPLIVDDYQKKVTALHYHFNPKLQQQQQQQQQLSAHDLGSTSLLSLSHVNSAGSLFSHVNSTSSLSLDTRSILSGLSERPKSLSNLKDAKDKLETLRLLDDRRDQDLLDKKLIGRKLPSPVHFRASGFENFQMNIRYSRGKMLGKGSFGTVYACVNLDTGEQIAVKVFELTAATRQLCTTGLQMELSNMQNLSHHNLLKYLGVEVQDNELRLFMEYCASGTLRHMIRNGPIENEPIIRHLTKQLVDAIAYLHEHRIAHRDVKSDNIFFDSVGNLKLGDFGASEKLRDLKTVQGEWKDVVGTPNYMAPELITQQTSAGHGRSVDIWAIGCVVIEMATGKAPWHPLEPNQIWYRLGFTEDVPPPPEALTQEGCEFTEKCLVRDPQSRPTASQLLRDVWFH